MVAFAAGRTLELDRTAQTVRLLNPDGLVELSVRITPNGPVLSFGAGSLELIQAGTLRLDVNKLEIRTREGMDLETSGSVRERIGGDHQIHCAGEVRLEAGTATVVAHSGDLRLDSCEDVRIEGERVLVNC